MLGAFPMKKGRHRSRLRVRERSAPVEHPSLRYDEIDERVSRCDGVVSGEEISERQ